MDRTTIANAALTLLVGTVSMGATACAGPPIPSVIEGEPICPDFEVSARRTPMQGGLRFPVHVTVLEGDKAIARTTVLGRRAADGPLTRIVLPDANEEYTVEWAQCVNERAPRPVSAGRPGKDGERDATAYECGETKPYKTDTLVTRKGDPASHALTLPPQPNPECWSSEVPAEPEPVQAAVDAGADAGAGGAAPTEDLDAGAEPAPDGDAATEGTAAPAPSTAPDPAPKPAPPSPNQPPATAVAPVPTATGTVSPPAPPPPAPPPPAPPQYPPPPT